MDMLVDDVYKDERKSNNLGSTNQIQRPMKVMTVQSSFPDAKGLAVMRNNCKREQRTADGKIPRKKKIVRMSGRRLFFAWFGTLSTYVHCHAWKQKKMRTLQRRCEGRTGEQARLLLASSRRPSKQF